MAPTCNFQFAIFNSQFSIRNFRLALLLLLLPGLAWAGEDEVLAIRAGRIETVAKGRITDGVIVIREGKIAALGTDVKIPVEATVIDAKDKVVMPGLVNPYSWLGRSAPPGGPAAQPHYRLVDELYPFQDAYRQVLRAGVTTLGLIPGTYGIGGQGVVVKPLADSAEDMAWVPEAMLMIHFQANTGVQNLIRNTLLDAQRDLERHQKQVEDAVKAWSEQMAKTKTLSVPQLPQPPQPDERKAPLYAALQGKMPVYIRCNSASEILYVLELLEEVKLPRVVLDVEPDVFRVADRLAEKKIPVILRVNIDYEPNTRNRLNVPQLLARAGVRFACRPTSDDVPGHRAWLFKMGELVKYGLDRETALRAITLTPAELLNVADRVGSLEVGKVANLLILSADPFDPLTRVEQVILEGKVVVREEEFLREEVIRGTKGN